MQHHELKKYLKFTMNKKPDKLKKYKRFCTRTDRNFVQKMFIIKEGCQIGSIGSQWKKFLKLIIILIKENMKKLTLCQRNE